MEAIALFQQSRKVGVLASDQALYGRLVKCLESIYYAKKIVMSCFQSKLAVHQLHALENNDLALDPQLDARLNSWTIRFRWIDDAESNSLQKLLLHLLDVATEKGYRKRGDFVMEPIQLPGGHNSHAWREVCSIKDFVYKSCSKEICFDAWQCLTHSSSNARSAVEYLSSCEDFQFRTLQQDRHIFSFSNGVYMAKENRVWLHEDSDHPLLDSVSAAKYFELELNKDWVTDDWRSIPTPFLDSIAIFQQWSHDVIDVLYMLLGRMLYDVNEMDGWQVMPFLRGAAGSGKSTLALNVVRQFYMPADVGLLSNNVEKKFGLSGLVHSLIFLAPEVRSDLAIEQAEWQSIVSGEMVQVAVKNKTASSVEWRAPGLMAGNEVPCFADSQGSVARRLIVFDFTVPVVTGADMRLGDKLGTELAAILVKCNRAYLEASQRFGHESIWNNVPAYFIETRSSLTAAVNSLEAFMTSGDVVLGADQYCIFQSFKASLKVFEQNNNYKHQRFTSDFFATSFATRGIERKKDSRPWQGQQVVREWLVGIGLSDQPPGGEAAVGFIGNPMEL